MNGHPTWPFYLALTAAGSIIVAAVLIALADGVCFVARHLCWWWRRRQDRLGRRGDLLEALARRIESGL